MVLKRGRGKPKRGGSHKFSSSRDPNAYVTTSSVQRRNNYEDDDDVSSEGSGSEVELSSKVATIVIGDADEESESGNIEEDSGSEEINEEEDSQAKPVNTPKTNQPSNTKPRELTRREREALEKEQARQHFLKMKQKEDAERLAQIRKKREEEAAAHAAALQEKEQARLSRRTGGK